MKPPNQKAKKEKEFRRILKRQNELYTQSFQLGYVKLEEPIRHGWFKVIELTPELERYKNAAAIKEVFKKIRTSYWGATKEKAQRAWDQERSKYMLSKDKPTISRKSFNKLSDKAKGLCVFFWYKNEYTRKRKGKFYINFPQGCYVIRYRRSYITHRKRIDPLIESEIELLDNRLMTPGLYELQQGGYWNRWERKEMSYQKKAEAHRIKEKLGGMRGVVDCLSDYDES